MVELFLGRIEVYPGEDEMEALAMNVLGALKGELTVKEYK
jgi:butyrate kinase